MEPARRWDAIPTGNESRVIFDFLVSRLLSSPRWLPALSRPPGRPRPPRAAPIAAHTQASRPTPSPPHTIAIDGKPTQYTARAGTITLRNRDDQPTARIFYTAYTVDGADPARRPVTFIYNGGPGSSTMWLRMGSFGPVRVVAGERRRDRAAALPHRR